MEDKFEQVYSQYNIDIKNVYRVRGTVYLETVNGLYIIRPYEYSENKAQLENSIKSKLIEKGYETVDIFLKNKDDNYITPNRYGNKYIVKKWFKGEECNIENEDEILKALQTLTTLHKFMQGFNLEEDTLNSKIQIKYKNKEYKEYLHQMGRVRKYIVGKHKRNRLELEILKGIDGYIDIAKDVCESLNDDTYEEKCIKDKKMLCHGELNPHNIILSEDGAVIVGMGKAYFGAQIYDVYSFLRKVLEKNEWDISLGNKILEGYNKNIPLSNDDIKILELMFRFPEKYYSLIQSYMNSQKVWISGRIEKKLGDIERQRKQRQEFIESIAIRC